MDLYKTLLVATLGGLAFIGTVTGYPNNVPSSPDICSKMTPGHGPRPQQSRPPYEIILNKQEMQGGNNLQIVIQGKKGHKFKGFYLQVRDQDGLPIGTFLIPDEKQVGAHNCFNQKNNAVHHKNRNEKESITVYWKAPESYNGKAKIQATVLQDFETYWIDVKPSDLVSVSTTTGHFFPSSDSLEKRKTEPAKSSKTTRVLNYNPYSPFSPLTSSWEDNQNTSSSAEFLLPQASEDLPARERQLFGYPSFDFHDSLVSQKLSSANKKPHNIHLVRPEYPKLPFTEPADHLPPYRPEKNVHPYHPNSATPTGSLSFNKLSGNKEKHSRFFHNPKISQPYSYAPVESPYHYHIPPPPLHETNTAPLFSANPYDRPVYSPPHLAQSIQNDKGSQYYINHHYLPKPHYPKPAIDPAYANSGYFPKDILTKLTSYIPNIYNALTNNPLFNFNIDNTIESIWKPVKGVPTRLDPTVSATTTHMQMPKYGYLVYNPVRNNPYFVIPAENEDEFVANHHLGRRKDTFSYS